MVRPLATFDVVGMSFAEGEPGSTVLEREAASLGDGAGSEACRVGSSAYSQGQQTRYVEQIIRVSDRVRCLRRGRMRGRERG
jgi:hypothetical protein